MFVWSKLSAEKWRDAWEERFLGQGQTNAVISALPGRKTIRVEVYCSREPEAERIRKLFGGTIREVKREEWAVPAAITAPPTRIRGRLLVTNTLENADAETVRAAEPKVPVLHVPPGLAFGTGDHATTATCLRVLADQSLVWQKAGQAWSMADLGTGTGILAMAAHVFGATDIYAMDYDPHSVRAARANFKRNRIRGIALERADLSTWIPARAFDFVAANVFFDVLTLSLPRLRQALAPGGCLVISGILKAHWPDLAAEGKNHGIAFPVVHTKGKWVTATGRHA